MSGQTVGPAPVNDRDALAKVIHSANCSWPEMCDNQHNGASVAFADAVLSSEWLRDHDEKVRLANQEAIDAAVLGGALQPSKPCPHGDFVPAQIVSRGNRPWWLPGIGVHAHG